MTFDFGRAALRHVDDASLLHDRERFPSADHLAGLAAECALKFALPLRESGDGDIAKRYHYHINELWNRVPLGTLGRRYRTLSSLLRSERTGPFSDWSIDQRYCDGSAVTQLVSETHLKAARRLCGAVGLLGAR